MTTLRIVGLSCSPRHANTEVLIQEALASAKNAAESYSGVQVQTEYLSLAGKSIKPCIDCGGCVRMKSLCILKDDWLGIMERLIDPVPDGFILGSPVYFYGVSSILRAFMERFTSAMKKAWFPEHGVAIPDWTKTAAGAISVGFHRNGGQEHAAADILRLLLISGFTVVGSTSLTQGPVGYIAGAGWAHERGRDAVRKDELGLESVRVVGENVGRTALFLAEGARLAASKTSGNGR